MFWDNLWNSLEGSMTDAFTNVIVWVGISLLFVESINFFSKEKFERWISNSKKTQPLVAGVLGLVPGCGATLFLVPMYNKRQISFGALVSSFVATMGDASFLILTKEPIAFLYLSTISTIIGIIVGYLIDFSNLGKKIETISKPNLKTNKKLYGHPEEIDKKKLPNWASFVNLNIIPIIFWMAILINFPMAIINISVSKNDEGNFDNIHLQNYKMVADYVSLIIMFSFIPYFFIRKIIFIYYFDRNDHIHLDEIHHGKVHWEDFKHIWRDVFSEILFVATWIFFGTWIFNFIIEYVGEENIVNWLTSQGALPLIFLAALVGLLPGCAPQILFATVFILFLENGGGWWVLIPAMTTHTISQDGDASFPLLATEKKAFILMKLINFIPALGCGLITYLVVTLT